MTGFVDPSSLSLPSSSLKRPASPDDSPSDEESPITNAEPPRKRPRSAVTPEERKEARAHRNRIAAQHSRDRRKAHFAYLERRVTELEEENRRLRSGFPTTPSPSPTTVSEPDVVTIEREQDQQRKRVEEQRERENEELRERIRMLEKGYEAVVRALAAQSTNTSVAANISALQMISAPVAQSNPESPPSQLATNPAEASKTSTSSPLSATTESSAPPFSHSPASSHSTLVDSPLMFASEYNEFPPSLSLLLTDAISSSTSLPLPKESFDLSLANSTPTRHLARVANTVVPSAVSLQRVGGARLVTGPASTAKRLAVKRSRYLEDEAASDAAITRLFAEILASPPLGSSTLPSSSSSSEDAFSKEVLTRIETKPSEGLGMSGIDTCDWADQVRAEIEMEKLLEMLPNAQDVIVDANPHLNVNLDIDMDFSSAIAWDGVSVF